MRFSTEQSYVAQIYCLPDDKVYAELAWDSRTWFFWILQTSNSESLFTVCDPCSVYKTMHAYESVLYWSFWQMHTNFYHRCYNWDIILREEYHYCKNLDFPPGKSRSKGLKEVLSDVRVIKIYFIFFTENYHTKQWFMDWVYFMLRMTALTIFNLIHVSSQGLM